METGLGSNPVQFLDATYTAEQAKACHLALRVTPDAASYALIETERNVVLAAGRLPISEGETVPVLLGRVLSEDPLASHFQSVSLGVDRIPFVLVPQALSEAAVDLPGFSFGEDLAYMRILPVETLKAVYAFALDPALEEVLHASFPHATTTHSAACWIQTVQRKNRFVRGHQLHLDVDATGLSVFLWNGADLLLHNHFATAGAFDVLYHALNVCQQHNLQPGDVQVRLTGQVEANDPLLGVLKEHFPQVELNFGLDFQRMALGLSRAKKQYFAPLFNQYVCVS